MKHLWERLCDWAFGSRGTSLITYGADKQAGLNEILRLVIACEGDVRRQSMHLIIDMDMDLGTMATLNNISDDLNNIYRRVRALAVFGAVEEPKRRWWSI